MEQITVTKEELLELVEKAVSKRLNGVKEKGPKTLFKEVSLSKEDIKNVNDSFIIPNQDHPFSHEVNTDAILEVSETCSHKSVRSVFHYKFAVHDNLRLISQRIVGASRNTDIDKKDYEFVEECYSELKEKFLELYEKALERKLERKDR